MKTKKEPAAKKRQPINPTVKRMFDAGYEVTLFYNQLTTYTAVAKFPGIRRRIETDHFTPAEALQAIADKIYRVGDYAD